MAGGNYFETGAMTEEAVSEFAPNNLDIETKIAGEIGPDYVFAERVEDYATYALLDAVGALMEVDALLQGTKVAREYYRQISASEIPDPDAVYGKKDTDFTIARDWPKGADKIAKGGK